LKEDTQNKTKKFEAEMTLINEEMDETNFDKTKIEATILKQDHVSIASSLLEFENIDLFNVDTFKAV